MIAHLGILLRHHWRLWRNAWRPDSRNRRQVIGVVVAVPLFMVALFAGTRYFLGYSGLIELLSLGETWSGARGSAAVLTLEALSMSSTVTFLILCLSALEQAFETFFLAPDLALLLAAPISRRAVFVYKFLANMRWDVTMVLVMAIPIWLAFAVWLQAPPIFYLALVLCWFLLLVLVSGLGTLLAMALTRLISGPRLRQIVMSFLLSVGLLVVVLIQGLITGLWNRESILHALEVQFLSRQAWLPSVWLSKALAAFMLGDGWAAWPWLAGLSGAAVLSFTIAHWSSMRFYSEGWSRAQEAERGSPRRAIRRGRRIRQISLTWALARKDLRLFFRQPMQWYQAVLGTVVMVMVLINFSKQTRDEPSAFMLTLVMSYVGASTFAMNLGLRGVTKEGLCWWVLQVSPLSEVEILQAKFLTAFIPTILYACLALVGMQVVLGLPAVISLLSLPIMLCMVTGMLALDVAVGIWRTDFQRATETRNADVAAVLVSQMLNYLLLAPGFLILSLTPLLAKLDVHVDLFTLVLLSSAVFLPLSVLVVMVSWRYGTRALRALRLSEDVPPIRLSLPKPWKMAKRHDLGEN